MEIDGDASGNVIVLFGNLNVSGHVTGNATVAGGNAVVDAQARISGRTTVIGGNAVYESDESLSGNTYIFGGHISTFAGRHGPNRRVSLSPVFSAALALLLLLLVAAFLSARPRRRSLRS